MSDAWPKTVRGTICGTAITLDEDLGLPTGTRVRVEIQQLADLPAISDEDRAILEHVYRERGCGVERDS